MNWPKPNEDSHDQVTDGKDEGERGNEDEIHQINVGVKGVLES